MWVFFTLHRSFYPSTSDITPFFLPVDIQHNRCECRFFNPINKEIQVMWSQSYATEILYWGGINFIMTLKWSWVSIHPLNCRIEFPRVPPFSTINQFVAAVWSAACTVRNARQSVVNTERNTPAVWDAVGVTTRAKTVTKEPSNPKPPYKYQRSPCLPGLSDKRCGIAMIYHAPDNCEGNSPWRYTYTTRQHYKDQRRE